MSDAEPTPDLRISDDERHAVAERLRDAAGEGRIDLDELEERLEATYAARTYADLVPITADLPVPRTSSAPVVRGASVTPGATVARSRHLAMMGGFDRKGAWTVPASMTVTAFMGGADLDLREASFGAQECVMTVNAFMGGATVTVGPGVDVIVEGTGIMGGFGWWDDESVAPDLAPDSPVLRIRGVAFWGGVSVERKERRDGGDGLPPGRKGPHALH
ncbi:DUF1707 domain-containing protein [Nocardioides sp. C4-1]|uniref:DUF1707 SHOCT-like domain-containing protein n=1 Tax=Nocardioides sp. C4-1 TaxID=3151851 RepID=UPI0032659C73